MTQEEFLAGVEHWNNHRGLLWLALEATKGAVVELGSGDGSTPFLRRYCKDTGRDFSTYDYDKSWADKMQSQHLTDWDSISPSGSVMLIDHSPIDRRHIDVLKYASSFEILVLHDTEPVSEPSYMMRQHLDKFKHVAEVTRCESWVTMATAVSNSVDLSSWDGFAFGQWVVHYGRQH